MDVVELSAISSSRASDYEIQHVIGSGQNGLVVAARCRREGLPNPNKLYALKLLFNFTHEYTSVVRNAYENEWLVLSRLLPHENIVRFWAQFISPIPEAFLPLLPAETRKHCRKKNTAGQIVSKKGQFLVLDYHPCDLEKWVGQLPRPLDFDVLLNLTEQLLEAVLWLEKNRIRHLDLKLSNVLVAEDDRRLILCDFGCGVQFSDSTFTMPYMRGILPGGNKAHLAPEVLNTYHRLQRDNRGMDGKKRGLLLDYTKQASFAVGVLLHELSMREHPLFDYPLGFTEGETIRYTLKDLATLPELYPKSFCSIVSDLLSFDPAKRMSIEEALNQLRVCCIKQKSRGSVSSSSHIDLERVKRERDIARVSLFFLLWAGFSPPETP